MYKELEIIEQKSPVINCNFEEVKEELKVRLADYENLVVTEDSLSFCKKEQKSLAGIKNKVDTYRKQIKKEMSAPITVFEGKCKELISLIDDAEKPIKEGIQVFDDKRKQLKLEFALNEIKRFVTELGLNDKFGPQMQMRDKYLLLTAKEKEVSADIEVQARILLTKQDREYEIVEIIDATVVKVNENLSSKINRNEFAYILRTDHSVMEIVSIIEERAKEIKGIEDHAKEVARIEAELEAKAKIEAEAVKEVEVEVKEEAKEEVVEVKPISNKNKIMTYTLQITGTKENLIELRKTMEALKLEYKII